MAGDRERESPKGELTSNWRQFVNKADKDLAVLTAGCSWKGKLTTLSEQEKERMMNEENRWLKQKGEFITHMVWVRRSLRHIMVGRKEFIEQYMRLDPTIEKPSSLRKEREGTQFGSSKKTLSFPSNKEKEKVIESPKRHAAEVQLSVPPKAQGKRESNKPRIDHGSLNIETQAYPIKVYPEIEEPTNLKALEQNKGENPSRWQRSYGSYTNDELRALEFSSEEEIRRAIHLIFSDQDLRGMPGDFVDKHTLIAPKEAVWYFKNKGLNFNVTELVNPEDLTKEELAEARRKYGM
jgi:hypothetical protein